MHTSLCLCEIETRQVFDLKSAGNSKKGETERSVPSRMTYPTNIERKLKISAGSLVGERLARSPDQCGKISDTVVHDKDDCKADPLVEWRMASLPNQFRKQKKYVLKVRGIF